MYDTRQTRALHHQKAFKPDIQVGIPADGDGVNGDLRICHIERSVFLCIKYNNKWYNASTGKLAGDVSNINTRVSSEQIRGGGGANIGYGSSGTRRANSSVVETANNFNYDSGWVAANNNTTVTVTHNLALRKPPSNINVYVSDNSDPVIGTNTILNINTLNDDDGLVVELKDGNVLEVHIGDGKLWNDEGFGNSSVPSDITNGYIRIIITL